MSLLLFAALAMVLFTACGRWDFSREAAKAANEAQNAVVFEASATLAQSLKDALEDKVQTDDVKTAMEADERLDDLLGRLDVYAVESDDAEAAAQTIADGYIKHISGRKSDGHIAMVKADNGWFYAAVVTTTGGSGSGSGGDDATTPTYTVTVDAGDGGTVVTPESDTITTGGTFEFTATPDEHFKATAEITEGKGELTQSGNTFTLSGVTSDVVIQVNFEQVEFSITVYVTGESCGQVKNENGELRGATIPLQVEDGEDIYLEFDAKDECVIESLVIDKGTSEEFDVMRAAGEGGRDHQEYTFKVVDEDHTVHVTFKNEEET